MTHFRLPRPFNAFIFFITVIFFIISFYWLDGYQKAKKENPDINFLNYVKTDTQKIKQALKTLPDIIKEASVSADNIRIGSLNKIAQALEIYEMDHGHYPQDMSEISGAYIDSKTKIFQEPSFYYHSTGGSYEMGIKLDRGEIYKVKN